MSSTYKSIVAVAVILLAGCAAPINQYNSEKYVQWAQDARDAGNYELAEQNYSKALINARLGHSPKPWISLIAYNLARMKAMLCKFGEAENLLQEALALEEQVSGRESGLVTMRLFELARVYDAAGRYPESIEYYEEAVRNIRALDFNSSDPIGFALVLDDYAEVLSKAGKGSESIRFKNEAEAIRSQNTGKQAVFKPDHYDQNCASGESNV
jgi:tetratricopeptide (TPR) repeat protein